MYTVEQDEVEDDRRVIRCEDGAVEEEQEVEREDDSEGCWRRTANIIELVPLEAPDPRREVKDRALFADTESAEVDLPEELR